MRPQLRGRINRQLKTPDRLKRSPRGDLRHEAIKAHSDFVSPAPQPPPAAIDAAGDGRLGRLFQECAPRPRYRHNHSRGLLT
jgi:hypothetical protein